MEKLASWRLRLFEYNIEIVPRAGVKDQAADALARLPSTRVHSIELEDEIPVTILAQMKSHNEKKMTVVPNWTEKKKLLTKSLELTDKELLTLSEFIIPQSKNDFREQSRNLVGKPGSAFTFDKNWVLVQKAQINGSIQKLVRASLRMQLLHQAHHSTLPRNPRQRIIYDSLWRDYCWLHMVTDVSISLRIAIIARAWVPSSNINGSWHSSYQLSFLNISPLIFWSITKSQYTYSARFNNHRSIQYIPTAKITSTQVAHIFFNDSVIPYGIQDTILADNEQQFVGKFFTLLCMYLEVNTLTTTIPSAEKWAFWKF